MNQPADNSAWAQVVERAYGLKPITYSTNKDFEVHFFEGSSLLGRPYLSSAPYLTDGGWKLSSTTLSSTTQTELVEWIKEKASSYALVKSRNAIIQDKIDEVALDQSYFDFSLDLNTDKETIFKDSLSKKTRNQLRKGLSQTYAIKVGGIELVNNFWMLISQIWRDLGTPSHSLLFFQSILEFFGEKARILLVDCKGETVAGALLIREGDTLHHPYAGCLKSFHRLCMNQVLYWKIIEWAIEKNCRIFDMGRSPYQKGSYHYKLSWGAKIIPLYYYYFMGTRQEGGFYNSPLLKMMTSVWRYMPLGLAKRLGPHFIQKLL